MEAIEVVPEAPRIVLGADPSIAELAEYLESDADAAPHTAADVPVVPPGEKAAAEEPETQAASDAAPPVTEKPGESAIDRRFSKLAKQRDEARQDGERLRAENDRLQRELAARPASPGPVAEQPKPAAAAAPADDEPKPPDASKWTGTWEELEAAKSEYVSKLADYRVAKALKARDQQEALKAQQAEYNATHAKWEEKAATVQKAHPEFQEAVAEVGPFLTQVGLADWIKKAEKGPDIVLYLHEHKEEALKIARLGNPAMVAIEIGKLEAKLSASVTTSPKPAAAARLPKPATAVPDVSATAEVDLEKADQATFNREVERMLRG